MDYSQHVSTKKTAQTQKIPGKKMTKNNAGGFGFEISKWEYLDRFLILGTEGNTYYQREGERTVENAENVIECIKEDGKRVVKTIVEVSHLGRAPKNDPAIFALALCATFGDQETKTLSYSAITKVCRIGTHIFHFCRDIQALRGWSRGLRNGVAKYYQKENIAYDVIKYRQRDGWTHRDVIRLAHPKMTKAPDHAFMKWIIGKPVDRKEVPEIVGHYVDAQQCTTFKELKPVLAKSKLPWEAIPTDLLKDRNVWETLLPTMPLTAMTRNLGRMSSLGLFNSNLQPETNIVVNSFTNKELVKKSRIHPIAALTALKTYAQGHGIKGSLKWDVCSRIQEALEEMFYISFGNVEATGLNWMLALDVSGSMTSGTVAGSPLAPFEATAAMAMVTARTEKNYEILGFCTDLQKLGITAKDTLQTAMQKAHHSDFGGTNAAAPIQHAIDKKIPVDVFSIYTDNETWSGPAHVSQLLELYRKEMKRPNTKLIAVGMTATKFSIVDDSDPFQMNVVGFDVGAVEAMRHFAMKGHDVSNNDSSPSSS